MATELQTKVASKGGVFGSTQKRFIKPSVQEGMPGPGQYTAAPDNKYNAATNKKTKHIRDQIKKSNSMYIQNQKSSALQAQSYIQQNEQDARKATKNYKNQIQYDNRTNTIGANVKKQ